VTNTPVLYHAWSKPDTGRAKPKCRMSESAVAECQSPLSWKVCFCFVTSDHLELCYVAQGLSVELIEPPCSCTRLVIPFIMRCFFQYIVGLLPSMASPLLSDDNLVEVFHFDFLDNDLTLERSENVVKGSQLPIKIEI